MRQARLIAAFLTARSQLMRAVARIVSRDEAEDIAQEAFVRCFEAAEKQEIDNPHAFLKRTATNLALNAVKRAEARLADSFDDVDLAIGTSPLPTLEATYDSDAEYHRFCQAVDSLPPQCQHAFVLRKVFGLSQREIAHILGVTESTVEKHVSKGLATCCQAMGMPREEQRSATIVRTARSFARPAA